MATVSSIAQAIATTLGGLAWVNEANVTGYEPASTGKQVCVFIVPFGQETRAEFANLDGDVTLIHTLTVEIWVQIKGDNIPAAMTTARDAGALCIARLVAQDGSGYTLARAIPFEESITPQPVTHVNVPWIIVALRVPVENEVTI